MGLIESKEQKEKRIEKERLEKEREEDEYDKNKAKELTERTKYDIKILEASRLITDEILFNFKAMKDTEVNRLLLKSVVSNAENRIKNMRPNCYRDYYDTCECPMCVNHYVLKDQIGKYQYDRLKKASIEVHHFNIRCIINHSIKPGDILIGNTNYVSDFCICKVLNVEHKYLNLLDASPGWRLSITYQHLLSIGSDSIDIKYNVNPRLYNKELLLLTPSLQICINQKYNYDTVYSYFNKAFIKVTDEEKDKFIELADKLKKIIHEKRVEVDVENEKIDSATAANLTLEKLKNDHDAKHLYDKLDRLYDECLRNYNQLHDQRQNNN